VEEVPRLERLGEPGVKGGVLFKKREKMFDKGSGMMFT
jgi:hypothetical protein